MFQYSGFGNVSSSHTKPMMSISPLWPLWSDILSMLKKSKQNTSVIANLISHADHVSEDTFKKMFLFIYYQPRVASQ